MAWSFYLVLDMRPGFWLEGSETYWVVDNDGQGREVTMYSQTLGQWQETLPLSLTRRAVLRGVGYSTDSDAIEAGKVWRARLMAAFASMRIGVDFGDRSVGRRGLDKAGAKRAGHYEAGILVSESNSPPAFMPDITATGVVTSPARLPAALAKVNAAGGLSEERQVTYELFSAALGLGHGDACYAMLMAALETMMTPHPRPEESVTHVDKLIELTRKSGLSDNEVNSITGSLRWLRQESIGQAGKRIAEMLDPNIYMDEAPAIFFRNCYNLRSHLLHGNYPLPTAQEIATRIPHLVKFTSDLIGLI
jgi:hypothetical protein